MKSLRGKTALVTGGAKRLGRAISLALAREGVQVVVHYNTSQQEAESFVKELRVLGVKSWAVAGNFEQPEVAEHVLEEARAQAGTLDFLINNASVFPSGTLWDLTPAELLRNVQINAVAPLLLSRAFAATKRPGHIVNLLDCRIVDYDAAHVPYHLSKRMLFSLTRMMAMEFAPEIQVNAVAPGLILPPEGKDESYLQSLAHTNPLKRYGAPEDIAAAVLFLLSSDFVTGQVIFVDGGRHMMGNFYG
ncbi:MAG TPA: SDR family oxidoreductase [Candidatus Hydrogenedentes bacterium]|nr:SDR family oxidoreductase [Candidatus Hydrogenedentota bacterium]HOL76441.1 SDR family oxidoreductase [Candidatus Hydrogenedentota bacterium]HPO85479.1 SDR family oxidoreductase [Candidatus Hydrogenedentota bacterium]